MITVIRKLIFIRPRTAAAAYDTNLLMRRFTIFYGKAADLLLNHIGTKTSVCERKRIAIVGGGASVMIAAIGCAQLRADSPSTNARTASGKSCLPGNTSMQSDQAELAPDHFHGDDPGSLNVLTLFPVDQTVAFFNSLGPPNHCEATEKSFSADAAGLYYDSMFCRFELDRCNVAGQTSTASVSGAQNDPFSRSNQAIPFLSDASIVSCGAGQCPTLEEQERSGNPMRLGHTVTDQYPVRSGKNRLPYSRHLKGTKIQAVSRLSSTTP